MSADGTSRRAFLAGAGGTAAALTIGFNWASARSVAARSADSTANANSPVLANAFVRIGTDDSVTVIAKHLEMGQGSYSGIATVLAEELDADWHRVRVESAPADAKRYGNAMLGGLQGTGGSSAMANSWQQLREAGAKARMMLLTAAAAQWRVPIGALTVTDGVVSHSDGRHARYGELVARAAALPVPDQVTLKDPKNFRLIGQKALPRIDVPSKVDGSAQFTLDVTFPGILIALLRRSPRFGGTVRSFDASAALAVPGVVRVVQVPRGIAVVAHGFWAARRGRDALKVEWDDTHAEMRGSDALMAEYRKLVDQPGATARKSGDAGRALNDATHRVSADYEFPYLAHAPMEPLDAVVKLTADGCDIWAGDQFQTVDQANAAKAAGLKPEQINIHTLYAGGSFGRRANPGSDYITEAVSIAKAMGADGIPVKLQWTREDDIQGGLYRPLYFHRLEAALDGGGKVTGWRHHIVGQSIVEGTMFSAMMENGIDPSSVEGASTIAYDIPNIDVQLTTTKVGVPVLWWRVVGSSHTVFAVESFIDEAAHTAGKDPLALRRDLLTHAPRMLGVLELAAQKAGWNGTPMPKGRGRGIAVTQAFKSYVAQVAEVRVDDTGQIHVERVVCAVDCGTPINPDIITAQMEGGIGFGLGAVLHGAITLKDGRVEQDNFNNYRVLRMNEMPKVEVYIVPSTEPPTGVGEPGVAPLGPAVANAVFAATGQRIRALPFPRTLST
jgi:isoquinoline 1-oxidoreductase beta subunit